MKPIKLTMNSFGPYADNTEIDFTKLGEDGLYLITGETGAGKTMIFDGICYALYGKSSGDERKEAMLKSNYTDDNAKMSVRLDFSCGGKKYSIYREYTEKKKKAQLTYPDGTIEDKEIDKKIQQITGLGFKQFINVAMIAQGKFREFMSASTNARTVILRGLFNTDIYNNIKVKLKSRYKQTEDKIKNLRKDITSVARLFEVSEKNSFKEEIANLTDHEVTDPEKLLEILSKAQEEEKSNAIETEKAFSKAERARTEILSQKKEADILKVLFEKYDFYNEQVKKLIPLTAKAEADFHEEEKKIPERKALEIKISEADKQRESYEKLAKLTTETKSALESKAEAEKKLYKLQESEKKLSEQLSSAKKRSEEIKNSAEKKAELEIKFKEFSDRKKNLDDTANQLVRYYSACEKYDKLCKEYHNYADEYEKENAECIQAERQFFSQQAGLLAMQLENDKPCPVCGSINHPSPAVIEDNKIDKQTLDRKKKSVELARSQMEKCSKTCGEADGLKKSEYEKITAMLDEYLEGCSCEGAENKIKEEISRCEAELKTILQEKNKAEAEYEEYTKILPAIDELTGKINEASNQKSEYEKQISTISAVAEEKEKSAAELKKSLEFSDITEYERYLDSKKAELKKLEESYQFSEDNYKSFSLKLSEAQASLKTSMQSIQGKEKPDMDVLIMKTRQAEDNYNEWKKTSSESDVRIQANANYIIRLKKQAEEYKKTEEDFACLENLKFLAGDKQDDSDKKSTLEIFVQMSYLDRIIRYANVRLWEMTEMRYELVRRNPEDSSGKGYHGLEIDVIDYYNEKQREVSTVSGGEGFIISLALALGLSDEVQNTMGGLCTESMFIDEGFGTLDDEYLSNAVKALRNLAEGNKMVGIISHVPYLQDSISKQIVVKKGKKGSTVQVNS